MMLLFLVVLLAPRLFRERSDPSLRGLPGFATYARLCLRCHGAGGAGRKASRIAGRPVELAGAAFRDTTRIESIRDIVARGKGKMKGFADSLAPRDIDAVSRFVLLLPTPVAPDSMPHPAAP